jgi:hypothetical protein
MTRAQDDLLDLPDHRRRTARKARHAARTALHQCAVDADVLEDAVLPEAPHDVGRKASPRPPADVPPGRRRGFKVWKTPFWKRRRQLWHQRNVAARRIADAE